MSDKPNLVSIAFACNNPDNGMFEGEFSAVNIGEELLDLSNNYDPPKCAALNIHIEKLNQTNGFSPDKVKGFVKISRRKFPILGYKYGWGNWCWDLVIVTPETAKEIIDYLKSLNCYSCESGETQFFEKFNSEQPFEWTEYELNLLKTDGWQRP